MTNPYRAMCAELLLFSEEAGEICINESLWPKSDPNCTLQQRARALLDQPMAERPSDWDLKVIMDSVGGPQFDSGPRWMLPFARAVLARWGNSQAILDSSPQPVLVSDEEIMELMPQQMRDDLAAAARALAGFDRANIKAAGAMRIILNRHAVDHARAVLAKWGRQ